MSLLSEGNISSALRSDSVHVLLDPSTHYGVVYCYHLTASNGENTVTVVGTFTGIYNNKNNNIIIMFCCTIPIHMQNTNHLFLYIACNPAQLVIGVSVPSEATCGASYSILGLENGIVCYSGTEVRATAVYYCLDCGYNTLRKSSTALIRTCGANGQWNGTIPQCDCSKFITLIRLTIFI